MSEKMLSIGWIVIVFLMVGYNIVVLKKLTTHTRVVPEEVRILEEKLSKLTFLKSKENKITKEKKRLLSRFFKMAAFIQKKALIKPKPDKQPNLPTIQGIINTFAPDGRVRRMVLINGQAYLVGQSVDGFLVEKITDKGVYLLRYGKRWFVPLPEVKFSIVKE